MDTASGLRFSQCLTDVAPYRPDGHGDCVAAVEPASV